MPNCTYCNKVFNDRQALGNHIRTHLDDSDKDLDLSLPNKLSSNTTTYISTETNVTYKKVYVEQKTNDSRREETTFINDEIINNNENINIYFPIESQSEEDDNAEVNLSDDESMTESSDEDSVISNLSYETNVDINEYNEYDALYSGVLDGPEDIYQEFPSKEYAEFMHIITKFHVQDSLANAFIKFFNKYSNRKDKPLPSTSQVVELLLKTYRTVLDGIHQILMNKDIIKDFIFESVKDTPNERQYTDMYDSDWWRDVEKNLPIGAYVMPIILYADATLCDHLGKTSRHPVFMTLRNIPLACRNKVDAKILFGYIPNLEYCSTSKKKSAQHRSASRELFHHALATILRPLRVLSYTGIHLYVNKSFKWFYPFLALIISDWPEACAMGAIYGSSNSSHPCHFCLVDRNTLNNVHIKKEDIIIRNEHDTKNVLRQGNDKQISTYYIRNALWKQPYFNVYTMCVPDRMHHADLGLFQYQLRFTVELLNLKYGSSSIKILEERLSQIPRYPNLKIFKSGFERLNRLTASEYRDLMKVMLFILDDLILDKNLNKNLCDLFSLWINMYIWSRKQGYTKSDLYEFENSIIVWSDLFIKLMSKFSPSNLNLPKLHSWRFHLIPSIYQFGAVSGFTSETYELLHKTNVKQPYRMTNKRQINKQMQAIVRHQNIMTLIQKLQSRSYNTNIHHGKISKKFIKQLTQHTIDQVIDQLKNTQNLNNLWINGFEKLKSCIYDYFQDIEEWSIQDIENETIKINVCEFAYLDNNIIIRATPNYYGQASFSDVCVEMDESEQGDYLTDNGLCYAKKQL
ncbi:hypothetical protein GLOIN_2v1783703 [Rhizophagus clarus]|uniref:C2H2-type domain-containing protein n=1 Tax=Rhizophagus clarus TaxID=94130 RepID=A0A8H3QPF1_9GLOM|nr:hypothetical protein GLOIN_2v1783703 [Rhizophagus clarus]